MEKRDLKKELKFLYAPSAKHFEQVQVPPLQFLMVDGTGDPNISADYTAAVEALFAVAYTIKFASKAAGQDFSVMPLEGLWSAPDPTAFTQRRKQEWDWTMMIMQPSWIQTGQVHDAIAKVSAKKSLLALPLLRFETYDEGSAVQILHIGSYDDEGPVLAQLHQEYLPANGLTYNGKHHEVYLSDPRRVSPGKLKTILRQPVRSQSAAPPLAR